MINVVSAFYDLNKNQELVKGYLLEHGFSNKFSLKQKLYYQIIRPIIPIILRQRLQKNINARIAYKKNFIDASQVDDILKHQSIKKIDIEYKNGKKNAIVLTHDVEEQKGFDHIPSIVELEAKYGIKSSWNIVPYKYNIDEGIINFIKAAGHEVGIHGYNHDGKLYYSERIFNQRVPFINKAIKQYGAVGFRSPQVHRNLLWLQKLDIEYDASCFDYDPFQPFPGGTGSIWPFIAGKFVELPYTLPQDHTIFYVLKQKDITIWKNKSDWVAENRGVILALTHPDYLIEKKHFEMYEELLKYLKSYENAWYCLPRELARWWWEMIEQKRVNGEL